MRPLLLSLLAAVLISALAAPTAGAADPLVVQTECGAVQASWSSVPSLTGQGNWSRVATYHSLPFAAPPVGDLRWAAPQKPQCWQGTTYDATNFKGMCVQGDGSGGVEDCLYLHVYVPEDVAQRNAEQQQQQQQQQAATRTGVRHVHRHSSRHAKPAAARGAPVLAYIHGGSLTLGSANYEPLAAFAAHAHSAAAGGANESVIVVSMNYRLNMFGWLSLPQFSAVFNGTAESPVANFGLLDQQAALQWVQRNIGFFGGDPSRVTLAGQSSGGTSIFAHYSSPLSRGLFQGAISMSGSINVSMSLAQGQAQNAGVVAATGCDVNPSPSAVLACLRALNVSALLAAQPASWATPGIMGLEHLSPAGMGQWFGGLPLVDGVVIQSSFAESLASDTPINDKPLMWGNTGQEADLQPDVDANDWNQTYWSAYLTDRLAGWKLPELAPQLLAMYGRADNGSATSPEWALTSLNADYSLTCGTAQLVRAAKMRAHNASGKTSGFTSPIYTFVSQFALSQAVNPFPGNPHRARYAYHMSDYTAVFENWLLPALGSWGAFSPNADDLAHAQLLQQLFADFIATGRVTSGHSASVDWQPFDAAPGFPAHHYTYVFRAAADNLPAQMHQDYKADNCLLLQKAGFDDKFWWVN